MTLERIIRLEPAWDRRSDAPNRNCGVHGVELGFFLKGPNGVIQFKVSTNWNLPHVQAERRREAIEKAITGQLNESWLRVLYEPMATDIGCHSYVPRYTKQTPITDSCEWLEGKPCYYDGPSLNAQPILEKLVAEGHEAVRHELEEWYHHYLDDEEVSP